MGCAAGGTGAFLSDGFHDPTRRYVIQYAASPMKLLPGAWRVSNFRYDGAAPDQQLTQGAHQSAFEWTGPSGVQSDQSAVTYDLQISHTSNAAIWVRSLPIPSSFRHKSISVLLENYVNDLTGSIYDFYLGSARQERRVATQVLDRGPLTVGGVKAHFVTFEIVNLDQLQMNQSAPRVRAKLVLVQVSLRKDFVGSHYAPAYLMLGYSNDADQFESHLTDFENLLKRVRFSKRTE
jgi:hypothetical protein